MVAIKLPDGSIMNMEAGATGFDVAAKISTGLAKAALAVKVNLYPCHIASLPVAVNIQCHASRHKVVIL
jgi:(p)ppGpp synthase/HD superfamily hydrolase